MTEPDPFDYPDEPAAEICSKPEPPQRVIPVPDHDDDEAAFWRNARAEAGRPPAPSDFGEWMAAERRVAYTVPCPDCMMGVGQPCIRIGFDHKPLHPPEPLRNLPAHITRLRLARKALA